MTKLLWCPHCKEKAVVVKFNNAKTKRWQICINVGCSYKQEVTYRKQSVWGIFRKGLVK